MRRDELIVQALSGMGVAVTVEQLKEARAIADAHRLRSPGRPRFGDVAMPAWVKWRRWRERQTGFSDPLLVQMGFSALPDAPSKPSKSEAAPKLPKAESAPDPSQPLETGSGAWAASLSWNSSDTIPK